MSHLFLALNLTASVLPIERHFVSWTRSSLRCSEGKTTAADTPIINCVHIYPTVPLYVIIKVIRNKTGPFLFINNLRVARHKFSF